jgi:probable rRNA maturation factor
LGFPDGEISILIVDDLQIEKLNRQYLQRGGPTNVIAFPMREGQFAHLSPQVLGDVVISMDTAAKEAKNSRMRLAERFNELLVHGILHLDGYDHDKSEADTRRMESKSQELLKIIQHSQGRGSNGWISGQS